MCFSLSWQYFDCSVWLLWYWQHSSSKHFCVIKGLSLLIFQNSKPFIWLRRWNYLLKQRKFFLPFILFYHQMLKWIQITHTWFKTFYLSQIQWTINAAAAKQIQFAKSYLSKGFLAIKLQWHGPHIQVIDIGIKCVRQGSNIWGELFNLNCWYIIGTWLNKGLHRYQRWCQSTCKTKCKNVMSSSSFSILMR